MFKASKYKTAIVSYTLALKENIDDDKELVSILHSNRAASHFYLKNFRSALNDCVFARKCNPKNIKSIYKGAECCLELKLYDDAVKWCEMGFTISKDDKKLKEIKAKSLTSKVSFKAGQLVVVVVVYVCVLFCDKYILILLKRRKLSKEISAK